MKVPVWPALMGLCLAGVGLGWALTLVSGLPASVYFYEAGRLMALFGFVLLAFQFLWVSRLGFVQAGMAPGQPVRLHRRCGVFALVLLVLHPSLLVISEALQGYGSSLGVLKILGVMALVLLIAAGCAALFARRLHLKVRTWKGVHRLAYAVFPLAFAHSWLLGTTLHKSGGVMAGWILLALIYVGHIYRRVSRRRSSRPPSQAGTSS
jgi:DMSO/TMAO reductase YedYZ heme-binding membrane subunit